MSTEAERQSRWAPSLPADERARMDAMWAAGTVCKNCTHWCTDNDDEDDGEAGGVGSCGLPFWNSHCASMMCPEDYSCDDFAKKNSLGATK